MNGGACSPWNLVVGKERRDLQTACPGVANILTLSCIASGITLLQGQGSDGGNSGWLCLAWLQGDLPRPVVFIVHLWALFWKH